MNITFFWINLFMSIIESGKVNQKLCNHFILHKGSLLPQEAEAIGLRDAIIWLGELGLLDVYV